jgi:hypothetical protein
VATPFVQGRLHDRFLEVEIRTACAHCGEPMKLVVDSELEHRIETGGPNPLVFEPEVDWNTFSEPTIIDGY